MNVLELTVDNAAELLEVSAFGAGALLRVETSATETGSYAEFATVPLVASTRFYTVFHAAGVSGSWYRSRYSTAAPGAPADYSTYSAPFRAPPRDEAYASLSMFRDYVRSSAVTHDADDPDSEIATVALVAAARAIDLACGRSFKAADTAVSARYFTPILRPALDPITYATSAYPASWYRHAILPIDDVFDLTGMVVNFDVSGNGAYTNAVTAYRAGPQGAASRGMPYTKLIFDSGTYPPLYEESVKVEALWGWDATPATIVKANLIQAARFFKRRDAPFGVAGSPDMGNELRLLSKLDPDVAVMVAVYKRNWGAA
jgi:hypothetical protein